MLNDRNVTMNDSMQSSSMANYNSNFGRNSYGMNDQHGGMANNSSDYASQNSQYNQYGPGSMPPGYGGNPRGGPMPPRPGMPPGNMGMMGQNYPPNPQQRFPGLSGPSIQQQGGPTPTLNQLLQNPNAARGYQAGYGYPDGPQKGNSDMTSQGYNPQGGWGNQQRPMNPYQQQPQPGFRPQGQMYGSRPPGMGYNGGGQYPNQYPSNGQRYPAPYNQSSASSSPLPDSTSGGGGENNSQEPPTSEGTKSDRPASRSSNAAQDPSAQQPQQAPPANEDNSASSSAPQPSSATGPPVERRSETPTAPPARPSPSPSAQSAGGSRSNTPAAGGGPPGSGGGSNSPMPPRPSSRTDQTAPARSPMTTPGYPPPPQQAGMMPPPGGPMAPAGGPVMPPNGPPGMPPSGPGMQHPGGGYPQQKMGGGMMPGYNNQYPQNQQGYNRGSGMGYNQGYPQQWGGPPTSNMPPSSNMGPTPSSAGPRMPNSYPYPGPYNSYNNMPPHSGGGGNMPPHSGHMAPQSGNMPHQSGNMPPHSGNMPHQSGNMPPHQSGNMPPQSGNMPPHSSSNMPGNMPPHSSGSMPPHGPMPPHSAQQQPPPQPPPVSVAGGPGASVSPAPTPGAQAAAHAAMLAAANQSKGSPGPAPPPRPNGPPGYPPQYPSGPGGVPGSGGPDQNGTSARNSLGMSGGHMVMNTAPAPQPVLSHSMSNIIKQEDNSNDSSSNTAPSMPPGSAKPKLENTDSQSSSGPPPPAAPSPISQASTPGPTDTAPPASTAEQKPVVPASATSAPSMPNGIDADADSNTCDSFKLRPDIKQEIKQESMGSDTVAPSPSNMSSIPEDDISSPSWPGTPSQTPTSLQPPTVGASGAGGKNQDVFARLLEMGEEPERRPFLEKLMAYMEDKGTPIAVVPAISKNAIDLYRLYTLTKERGGLVEVTKNKKWREIGGHLNVGTSSSAGFTLKKNYCKYLFHYECRYDNNNIDPAPILAQIEANQKKDSARKSGQSPGPRLPFPRHMLLPQPLQSPAILPSVIFIPRHQGDGRGNGPMMAGPPMGPGGGPMMPPNVSMMAGGGPMYPGAGDGQGQPGMMQDQQQGQQYPGQYNQQYSGNQQYNRPYNQYGGQDNQYNQSGYNQNNQYPNRPMNQYPGYDNRGYDQQQPRPPTSQGSQDGGYPRPPQGYNPRPNTPDQYQGYNQGGSYGGQQYNQGYKPGGPGMYPQGGGTPQKYPGYSPNMPPSGLLPQLLGSEPPPVAGYPMPPVGLSASSLLMSYGYHQDPYNSPNYGSQMYYDKMGDMRRDGWSQQGGGGGARFPPSMSAPQYGSSPVTSSYSSSPSGGGHMYKPQQSPQRGPDKPPGYFSSSQSQHKSVPKGSNAFPSRRDAVNFPPDSVEATEPRLAKRKRINHRDIEKVEPWRLYMSLRSGLLAEGSWAIDTLNILLFDDHTVQYFGLAHMPGLMEVLTEHWRRCLIIMFGDVFEELEIGSSSRRGPSSAPALDPPPCKRIKDEDSGHGSAPASAEHSSEESEAESDDELFAKPSKKRCKLPIEMPRLKSLQKRNNYTLRTRSGKKVMFLDKSEMNEVMFDDREWDRLDGVKSGLADWDLGRGDTTVHVVTSMDTGNFNEFARRRFSKHLGPKRQRQMDIVEDAGTGDESESSSSTSSPLPPTTPKTLTAMDDVKVKQEVSSEAGESDSGVCVKNEPDSPLDTTAVEVKEEIKEEVKKDDNLNDSYMDVKDLITSIECNEMDKKFLEKLKRKLEKGKEESEAYQKDTPPLNLTEDSQEELSRRCVCISNIFRNLSFIPGNDREMSRHMGMLALVGKLLLLHHRHAKKDKARNKFDREPSSEDALLLDDVDDAGGTAEWWWDALDALRENALVILANIAGHLHLSEMADAICMPLLNGLLHWAICPSACAQDPLPSASTTLSPQRLVLEALCKLCVTDTNVDLLLATPPFSRIVHLFVILVRHLADRSDQVLREFSIVLVSSLVAGGDSSAAARTVALQHPAISLLIDFVEAAEGAAAQIVSQHGANGVRMLQDNPEMMGTSLDMLRRAANTLKHLAMVPENRSLFFPQQDRLLALVMSHVMDHTVTSALSDVLFYTSQDPSSAGDDAGDDS